METSTRVTRAAGWADAHWRGLVVAAWIVAAGVMIWVRWQNIYWFALSDTDDNMRMLQVRDLLAGQDWFDLRQYRMDPPYGANIHWSRIVDLPIAGLRLFFDMFMDGPSAERAAAGVAPVLPLGVVLTGVALVARRLIGTHAFLLGVPMFFFGATALAQFLPTRIDHHGWQLAMLALILAGLVDPRQWRGGVTTGLASAVSLAIGLEFIPYVAAAAGITALYWAWDADQRRRLSAYGAALGIGTGVGFALFASYANRAPVCDALSPVWLSVAAAGGAMLYGLPRLKLDTQGKRLIAAVVVGALLAAGFALAWPHCLGQLEGASPELRRLWMDNVREVKPIMKQADDVAYGGIALPVAGLLGSLLLAWTRRRDIDAIPRIAAVLFLSAASLALLFWQTRAAPGAQLLAVPGATALAWILFPKLRAAKSPLLRVLGPVLLIVGASGAVVPFAFRWVPEKPVSKRQQAVGVANRRCQALPAMRPLTRLAPGTVLTFVDLSPRLVALTPHSAIAGPYHRNGAAIVDIFRAFRGTAEQARAIVMRRRVDYVLICPNMSESTLYSSEAPRGFYVQLRDGRIPAWLAPVPLPKNSPFKMWRVRLGV